MPYANKSCRETETVLYNLQREIPRGNIGFILKLKGQVNKH